MVMKKKHDAWFNATFFHDSQIYKEIQGLANSPCFVLDLKIGISFRRANDRLFARMHVRKEPLKKQTLNWLFCNNLRFFSGEYQNGTLKWYSDFWFRQKSPHPFLEEDSIIKSISFFAVVLQKYLLAKERSYSSFFIRSATSQFSHIWPTSRWSRSSMGAKFPIMALRIPMSQK